MSYIMLGLGWVLKLMYTITSNYGIAIILFTIIIKLILMPLTVKQQKSMLKTQKLQPLLMEIQKKYGNDKDKLNQETMKLYQKYKINTTTQKKTTLIGTSRGMMKAQRGSGWCKELFDHL